MSTKLPQNFEFKHISARLKAIQYDNSNEI